MKRVCDAILGLGLLVVSGTAAAHDGNPANKLVDFWQGGEWEVWCIDYGGTGETIVCDLNIVVNYEPHPDFRAFIPRIYVTGIDESGAHYRVKWDYESQTGFAGSLLNTTPKPQNFLGRNGLPPGGGAPISGYRFEACARPCNLDVEISMIVVGLLSNATTAHWDFADNNDENFSAAIDLDGFQDGLKQLAILQEKYGYDAVLFVAEAR